MLQFNLKVTGQQSLWIRYEKYHWKRTTKLSQANGVPSRPIVKVSCLVVICIHKWVMSTLTFLSFHRQCNFWHFFLVTQKSHFRLPIQFIHVLNLILIKKKNFINNFIYFKNYRLRKCHKWMLSIFLICINIVEMTFFMKQKE